MNVQGFWNYEKKKNVPLKPTCDRALKGVGLGIPRAWDVCSGPAPWHGAAPQDKGTRPLEAPRCLFLPQGIKDQTKKHSQMPSSQEQRGSQAGMSRAVTMGSHSVSPGLSPHMYTWQLVCAWSDPVPGTSWAPLPRENSCGAGLRELSGCEGRHLQRQLQNRSVGLQAQKGGLAQLRLGQGRGSGRKAWMKPLAPAGTSQERREGGCRAFQQECPGKRQRRKVSQQCGWEGAGG